MANPVFCCKRRYRWSARVLFYIGYPYLPQVISGCCVAMVTNKRVGLRKIQEIYIAMYRKIQPPK